MRPVVRLLWAASALLTLARGSLRVLNALMLIEHASWIKRVFVPVMTVVMFLALFVGPGELGQ